MDEDENELVILTDDQFEFMAGSRHLVPDETGKLLIRTDGYKETFIRIRDWEKTQPPFEPAAQAVLERIEKARRARYQAPGDEPRLYEHEYGMLRAMTGGGA
jgi:hypothetical protein